MKTKLNLLTIIGFTLGTLVQLHSQGYIVPNGVTYGGFFLGYQINVIQNPANLDYTIFFLNPQGFDTFQFASALDGGVRVFWVDPNDPISLQPILSQTYTELLFPVSYVFDNGIPFYLGLYTGSPVPINGIYQHPLFGWAELINNGGVIQLLDSALEYGGGGIITGTQTIIPIPEPTAIGLFALGSLLLIWQRRQN